MPHKDPEVRKAYHKAWREANRERKAAMDKAYRQTNRERRAASKKAWYEANREQVAAKRKAWCEANRERESARSKAWYEANRERKAATNSAWRKTKRELYSEQRRKRRAQKKNTTVPLTANEKEAMRVLGRTRISLQEQTGRDHHIDHIVPLDYGGIHHPCNLQVIDGSKNIRKNNKITPEALALVGENYRLYRERLGLEKAEWFRNEIAQAIGLEMANRLIDSPDGAVTPTAPTLEDLLS